ncbi:MAG: glycoside hydrolase family 43 protein [Chitinophagales bacterium]
MKKLILLCCCACLFLLPSPAQDQINQFRPGDPWNDIANQPINAHGGGILKFKQAYYWFGEIKKGRTWRVPGINTWEDYRVNAGGISCYSSTDLVHWKYLGVALAPEADDSNHDLHTSRVIERPKVIYNDRTHHFVMWMHIDKDDYSYAHAGVAVSDKPEGPYRYLGSMRPNGQASRDMTLFKDDDEKAYLVYSSEDNKTMQICLLTDDYLKPTSTYKRILIDANREAPALFKHLGKYFLISSLCSGWDPNKALYAEADHVLGDWKLADNPCRGPGSDKTYGAQSTYVLPISGKGNAFIFMADRWNKTDLENSRYVWLPLHFENGRPVIEWKSAWSPSE